MQKFKTMKIIYKIVILFVLIQLTGCSEDTVDFTGVGKITGRVVEAENFEPIENAKVVLTPTNNTVFTDADGYFVYEEVEAGDYSVSATKESFLTNVKEYMLLANKKLEEIQEERGYKRNIVELNADNLILLKTINGLNSTLNAQLF